MSGKCLMVMAHPDDEIIFGWPIFQDKSIEKEYPEKDYHRMYIGEILSCMKKD